MESDFENGVFPSVQIRLRPRLTDEQRERIRKNIEKGYGAVAKAVSGLLRREPRPNEFAWGDDAESKYGLVRETRTCKIFDANGLQWRCVVWCNAETGEIEYVPKNKDGRTTTTGMGDVLTVKEKTAAPLRLEWDS